MACVIGAGIFVVIQFLVDEPYTLKNGIGVPEHRLIPGIYASAVAAIGILLFGWTSRTGIHWIVPTIGITIYQASGFIVNNPCHHYFALRLA